MANIRITNRSSPVGEFGNNEGDEKVFFYGYVIVIAAFVIMTILWAAFYAFGIFFKPILNEFGWTRAVTSGAFSLTSITMGLVGIPIGWLSDRFGPRNAMALCGLLLGAGYILMSQLNALWQFYLFYGIIVGTGMAGGFVPVMTTVARWFQSNRGFMTGLVSAGIGIGAFIGPPAANWLITNYEWRTAYLIMGIIVLITIVGSALFLKRDPSELGLGSFGSSPNEEEMPDLANEGLSLKEAIRTKEFNLVVAIFFCFGFCLFSVMVHLAAHTIELGFSPSSAANILATLGGLSIIGKISLGRGVDIFGPKKILFIGMLIMATGLFWLVPAGKLWMLYTFAIAFGLSYGGSVPTEAPIVALLFGLRYAGLILGVAALGFTIGGALGPWITGYIFDVTNSYKMAFLLSAILCTVGAVLTGILKARRVY